MATINISGSDTSNGNLTLSNNNPTVSRNETVTWVIQGNSGVSEITQIHEKVGSGNVFVGEPGPVAGSTNYSGVIASGATGEETYYIKWKDASGNEYTYDPKITVSAQR